MIFHVFRSCLVKLEFRPCGVSSGILLLMIFWFSLLRYFLSVFVFVPWFDCIKHNEFVILMLLFVAQLTLVMRRLEEATLDAAQGAQS